MGSGALSTRLRSTPPSFCRAKIDGEMIVQDSVPLDREHPRIDPSYVSSVDQPGVLRQGEQEHQARPAAPTFRPTDCPVRASHARAPSIGS